MALPPPPALALLLLLLALPAELVPQPVSDMEAHEVETFAEEEFNKYPTDGFYFRGLQTFSLEAEMDEVKKYHLKMEMVKTQCRKEKGKLLNRHKLQNCRFAPEAEMKSQNCTFEISCKICKFNKKMEYMICSPP